MVDLVGTCPKAFWLEWIAEGDPAGEPWSGKEWSWYTGHHLITKIEPGDRFYVVAHGKLRGWAPVTRIRRPLMRKVGAICREGNGVACTIEEAIPGFRGLRVRWWDRNREKPFYSWRLP
jgi:hypothetical protein